MVNRRNFIRTTGLAGGAILAGGTGTIANSLSGFAYESKRPPLKDRKFTSEAVESVIKEIKASIKDPGLGWLFENCYPIRLAYGYWKATGDDSVFDTDWENAMGLVLQTFRTQQRKKDRGPYKFQRITGWQTDTVAGGGYGNPVQPVGMICSIFRPSDDATIYPFLIPSNLFAITSLRQLAEILIRVKYHTGMDPAGEVYRNTRKFLTSASNPYYYRGKAAEGQGGPHSGVDMIWPLGITMRALTSKDPEEIRSCLTTLKSSHAGTGFMHESFHKDDVTKFTRKWFAWANTLFGELILKVHAEQPNLLM